MLAATREKRCGRRAEPSHDGPDCHLVPGGGGGPQPTCGRGASQPASGVLQAVFGGLTPARSIWSLAALASSGPGAPMGPPGDDGSGIAPPHTRCSHQGVPRVYRPSWARSGGTVVPCNISPRPAVARHSYVPQLTSAAVPGQLPHAPVDSQPEPDRNHLLDPASEGPPSR